MANRQMQLMNEARASASFDSRELTNIIYGGAEAVKVREAAFARIERVLQTSDLGKLPDTYGDVDRTGQFLDGLRFGKAMLGEKLKHGNSVFDIITPRYHMCNASPFGVHVVMFIPALKLLASPEQLAYWLPLAESCKIIGTYCQTELGHGSFIRGLETTATFDLQNDEFILHSPTISSTKYWPGGLGYSASHAIVMACLFIGSRNYGVHPFIVQLRSLEDFTPLPGIELGDIGLKAGHNSVDNGFAIFTHVRIPRAHLLARHVQVAPDGTYTANGARAKLVYGTMLFARRALIGNGYFQLAQAATIALRYSVVREQGVLPFTPTPDAAEVPLLTFRAQKQRLLTLMARTFALMFAARDMGAAYDVLVDRDHFESDSLPGIHVMLAGLKAYATQTVADGVEDARKCCGGHGYLAMSGFPDLVATATVNATLEGENYVMHQQTARYLVKCVEQGETVDATVAYLRDSAGDILPSDMDVLNSEVQLRFFRHRATRMVKESAQALRTSQTDDGLSPAQAWNTHMMCLIAAARAHTEYSVLRSFVDAVRNLDAGETTAVLKRLCDLFALTSIDGFHGQGFMEDGYLSATHLRQIWVAIGGLLDALVPDAVALTDAWNFSDASLQSALGCRDGNVYERMMEWTRQVPLNVAASKTRNVFVPGFEEFIRPIIKGKL
ncbi:acyl-CoA dehydrogenase/oxidase [Mycena galopus ATCC 62051]|nr:acyl-CoA dehydrogenase/oxidase [Mycena galopus ATCC 62051]